MGRSKIMDKLYKRFVEDEDEKRSFTHSTGYHTFFQGYSERKVVAKNAAGYSIEREYTAHYLAFTDSRKSWIGRKILYAALYLAGGALLLLSLSSRAQVNNAPWAAVFGALQLVALLLLLVPLLYYATAPMKMEMGRFNISAKRVGFFSLPAAVLAWAYLLVGAVWYAVFRPAFMGRDLRWLVCQLLSAAAITVLCVTERRTRYRRIENERANVSREANEIW